MFSVAILDDIHFEREAEIIMFDRIFLMELFNTQKT